ncbi:dehydrogenase [Maribacter algicola]|uniref:Dehydrogenase n=1 Tax=Maribacter algicola TaxID=2498892 RepID=A0A426RP99_9FLAO|nr:c-type cytochrome [Maribacter algicola]RRQ50801.1 dehydrogenase [Maribacter algicola]
MKFVFVPITIAFVFLCSCKPSYEETEIPLDTYTLEEGFTLKVLASEPLLKAPVAMDFDDKGRMWVAQMPGYMNDMQGSAENDPVGSIRIIEDLDHDGIADHAKIFLDSLVMPRALAHVYGGLLYAEPPYLWFVEIKDDKPANPVLVDSLYAVEGNPEHQPNGLLLNVDNWIYNAKSNFRYRRKNGVWEKEPTTFRGQWGISKDNFGRLYYNDNSRILLGDYVLPNSLISNKYSVPSSSVDNLITSDQRVYPLHATSVNRGYAKGVLNQDSILINATAACSPLVYRGGTFSDSYDQNVFVCLPEGNLIKRTILNFQGDSITARHAWKDKEFLASTDEGFRPVSIKNAPDGSIYIVDMHRGMIGHHAYLSPYLKKKTSKTRLDTITDFGRILRVKREGTPNLPLPDFKTTNGKELISLLSSDIGWIRDRAQHHLIHRKTDELISEVKNYLLNSAHSWGPLHALYVLEDWNELSFEFLTEVIKKGHQNSMAHALVLSKMYVSEENKDLAKDILDYVLEKDDITLDIYLSSILGDWIKLDSTKFTESLLTVLNRHPENPIVLEALVSGLDGIESGFIDNLDLGEKEFFAFKESIQNAIANENNNKLNPIFSVKSLNEDNRTSGAKLFSQICASCHGINGQGIEGLAPPLINSEHVDRTERLALIMLHGLEGPIHVNGQEYDLNLAMPGLIRNEEISDKDIADLIAYVTNAFSPTPRTLKEKRINELRNIKSSSGTEFTEDELLQFDVEKK